MTLRTTFPQSKLWHSAFPRSFRLLWSVLGAGISLAVLAGVSIGQSSSQRTASPSASQIPQSDTAASDLASFVPAATRPHVLIDVVLTDPHGRTVAGLTEKDFQVSEKVAWATKVPQKIAGFRVVDKARQPNPKEPADLLSTAPVARADAGEPAAPLTVLLLDSLNTDLSAPAARQQVATMADVGCNQLPIDPLCATVPVAVLRLGDKLELLQDFNPNRTVLRSTLQNAFPEGTPKKDEGADSKASLPAVPAKIDVDNGTSALSPIRDWDRQPKNANDQSRRMLMTMDAIRSIARHLAGYPGRKRLIWVSSAYPFSIAPDPATSRLDDVMSYRQQTTMVAQALVSARVSVYPARPANAALYLASRKAPGSGGPPGFAAAVVQEVTDNFAATGPMEVLAAQTGGFACFDDKDLATCFSRALRDGLFDYEIAYYPAAANEGFHRVIIHSTRQDLHLSYPHYYYARSESPAGSDLELKQAACDDLMTSTSLAITAAPETALPTPSKYSLVVDGNLLTAVPLPENSQRLGLRLDLAVCAFDAQGRPLQHVQYRVRQEMSAEEFKSVKLNGFQRLVDFQPAEGTTLLRWVVRDSRTGNLGSVDLRYKSLPSSIAANSGETDRPDSAVVSSASAQTGTRPEQAAPAASLSSDIDFPPRDPDAGINPYCEAIAAGVENSSALAEACRFSLSLSRKMPNVICDLETKRFWLAHYEPHRDVVNATVTYANGGEQYSDIHVDGTPANAFSQATNSSWSMGELASILQMVFSPTTEAEFKFTKVQSLNSTPALVFEFHVDEASNLLYYLHVVYPNGYGTTLLPAYGGKIWLNKSNFQLMRMEKEANDMPRWFPITRASTVIDYANVPLGDGSTFVLPVKGEIETCSADEGSECAHNVVRFANWHKFRAKIRILPIVEPH